jgi:HEAT repeat protein
MQKALKHKDVKVRINIACLMVTVNYERNDAIPILVEALKSDNRGLKMQAAFTLAPNQLQTDKLLPLFVDGLKDKSAAARAQAANGLAVLQKGASAAAPALGLKDSDNQVRLTAGYHGSYYGQKSWGPLVAALASTKDAPSRQAILQSLQGTDYRSKTGVTPVMECLKDADPSVRQSACNVLGNIGPDAANALPLLRALTKDNIPMVQQAAQGAIKRIEPPKK